MRVLYSFPHPFGSPGIGTIAFEQVKGVLDRGHEIALCTTSIERQPVGLQDATETLRVAGVRIPHRVLGPERAYAYHDHRVARLLRSKPAGLDLVHCWPMAAAATARAARLCGIKVLREVPNTHTIYALERVAAENSALGLTPPARHSHAPSAAKIAREDEEYRLADLLLVPSESSRQTFIDRGFDPERLALHDYGYDPTRFFPPPDGLNASGRLRAVFVGRCEPRKGLHHALQAWLDSGACSRGTLTICGTFIPGYRQTLEPAIDHPSVSVIPFRGDIDELMRNSDVLLLPSVEEGSALVTYEAMACGCALLVSDAAGARCTHERQGLIHPAGDQARLTEHLRSVAEDSNRLLGLRRAAADAARELTWAHAAARLVDVYSTCVSAGSPRRP